jgi:hypothetical protein
MLPVLLAIAKEKKKKSLGHCLHTGQADVIAAALMFFLDLLMWCPVFI